jgi:hypothetical protein
MPVQCCSARLRPQLWSPLAEAGPSGTGSDALEQLIAQSVALVQSVPAGPAPVAGDASLEEPIAQTVALVQSVPARPAPAVVRQGPAVSPPTTDRVVHDNEIETDEPSAEPAESYDYEEAVQAEEAESD